MRTQYKVLIADDEYWIRENLRTILDWEKYSFIFMEPAIDGEDALRKIEEDCPDILITDINMPFLDGIELLTIIKKRFPKIITIILSGYNDFEFVRQAMLLETMDYLLKPVEQLELINVLTNALNRLDKNERLAKEQVVIRDKLKIAASLMQDREFSMYIAGEDLELDQIVSQGPNKFMEFKKFYVMVIRVNYKHSTARLQNQEQGGSYKVKQKIIDLISSEETILFNNIFSINEYILILNRNKEDIKSLSELLIIYLEEVLSAKLHIGISQEQWNFKEIKNAYQEAVGTFGFIPYYEQSITLWAQDVKKIPLRKRMVQEQEKQLIVALQNKNKKIIKQLLLGNKGIITEQCKQWLFIELKQTLYRIIWIIENNIDANTKEKQLLLESFSEWGEEALNTFEIKEVIEVLDQILDEALPTKEQGDHNKTIRDTICLVKKYIDEKYFENLSLTILSEVFFVEKSYLSKAFKQETGENLMLYIARRRIEKATELIRDNNLSLTEISFLVGYEDYAYFNRVFRKVIGKSPREYKSQYEMLKV
ncbi:response regulator transcription factor [Sporanaerobium hydrogeniformans]|uniref:response regulator transcription factor n=1 Tax=Sporanaerobium hydrogeniformans TaxID=3072179 RepID=UPI0015D51110|nr:response regulator [Sporanaerobium hydrogeniformans]